MRKQAVALLVAATILGGAVTFALSGGDAFVSKGYADGAFSASVVADITKQGTAAMQKEYAVAEASLAAKNAQIEKKAGLSSGAYHATFEDARFARGDKITVPAGSSFMLLAGEAELSSASGVADVTAGQAKTRGALAQNARYLTLVPGSAVITVGTPTAVLSLEGEHSTVLGGQTDYEAVADAMKTLGLFQGSDTGYGRGYNLEAAPTRLQGVILFLRLVGEEPAALASSATCPFADVPAWGRPYVAYAYARGYTKGVDAARFSPDAVMTSTQYMTFILRALGYASEGATADFLWEKSLQKGLDLGAITAGEHKMLTEDAFLRAQTVYLSYFALEMKTKAGATLETQLTQANALDAAQLDAVRATLQVPRL